MKLSIPQLIWEPTAEAVAAARVTGFIQTVNDRTGLALSSYDDLWTYSTEDIAGFWAAVAQYFDIRWHQPPASVLDDPTMPGTRWFPNATLNYAEHALRTPGGADENHLAVLSIREDGSQTELTLTELRSEVGAAQAGLRRLGVGPGVRVVALVPNTVHALIGFLATAALGAVWSSCSPDFGAGSILDRFIQVEPTVLIAVDGYRYGGKSFRTDETVRKLLDALPSLAGAVHIPELDTPTPTGMIGWNELTARRAAPEFTAVPFSAPLWILYSSGTTGLPKPIVHSVGGILLEHLKSLGLQWDIGPGDRFLWFTTTGWMMWNFLIGGLLVGSTVILYDGSPGYPDLTTLWRIVGDHRASVFGVSAAFVTACQKAGVDPSASISLDALRTIGSTGSPLDESGFDWLSGQVGRDVPIISFSGGTDLCTGIVGGAPIVPVWRGEISCRALGARVESYSAEGLPMTDEVGELVITAPMPSMPVFLWGDSFGQRLRSSYFEPWPGVWRHGDWIEITSRGTSIIQGRSDATLNRGGIRMGTAEFYRVVEALPEVDDSLVVDTSSAAGDGDLLLFVVLVNGGDPQGLTNTLRSRIRTELSPRHVPTQVVIVPTLPRTLNGKKCEVPVKRILAGATPGAVISRDALADPTGFDDFLDAMSHLRITAGDR
jgi:acetoacetyl-CoA synthetase